MPKVVPEYKEEAKKRIIAAGVEVMSKRGYSQTTMEDIAAHLGVSKGALYLYFKNKDELILESAKNMQSQLSQLHKMQMATSPTRRPLDVWTETLDNFVPFNPQINMLFFELVAVTERNPEINKISSKNLADEIEILEHEITTQQQDGLIRTDVDPRTIVVALISIFNGLRLMNILGMDQSEIRKRWIEMGRIILGAKD